MIKKNENKMEKSFFFCTSLPVCPTDECNVRVERQWQQQQQKQRKATKILINSVAVQSSCNKSMACICAVPIVNQELNFKNVFSRIYDKIK